MSEGVVAQAYCFLDGVGLTCESMAARVKSLSFAVEGFFQLKSIDSAEFYWRSESDASRPTKLVAVDDRTTADAALRLIHQGHALVYEGDFVNAKQLLAAMARRLAKPPPSASLAQAFRNERHQRNREHMTLSQVLVVLEPGYRSTLRRAPETTTACQEVWGADENRSTLVSLKTLVGMLGASQWRKTGMLVPPLKGRLTPHYGVYLPTRFEYVELLGQKSEVKGKTVIEVGTGTGVLSLLLLQKGALSVHATDVDERAVNCARANAKAFGFEARFKIEQKDLFPEACAEVVVCNPPWLPEMPKNRVDRAVFDADSAMLLAFLKGLLSHLTPGGAGLLILSDLAERLSLRPKGWLSTQFAQYGLQVDWTLSTSAKHGKAHQKSDPLYEARRQEVVTLYRLSAAPKNLNKSQEESTPSVAHLETSK